jgi:hypothetical protein
MLFDDVLEELCVDPRVEPAKMFGHRAAKLGKKMFAFEFHGSIVVKLGAERAAAMVAAEQAELFDPSGKGHPMRAWAVVPEADGGDPVRAWVELAEEAKDVVDDDLA